MGINETAVNDMRDMLIYILPIMVTIGVVFLLIQYFKNRLK